MEIWKEFETNEITHSAAHYLMAIHDLSAKWGYARVSDVADKLNITKGSASQRLKQLKVRGLVVEDEHRLLHLSDEGEKLAERIAGRAQVLKQFFHEMLGVDALQAEIDACKIEHLISHATSERLIMLVRFMASQDPGSKKFMDAFSEYKANCPGLEECQLCETKCLMALEDEGIAKASNAAKT